jgi:hypothetical protein
MATIFNKTLDNRYSGLLELTKMRKHGYPIRLGFSQFALRYRILCKSNSNNLTPRDVSRLILTSSNQSSSNDFQLGSSKVFLREVLEQRLEKQRYEIYSKSARKIQSIVRGHLARKRYRNLLSATIAIQSFWRMEQERRRYTTLRNGVIKLQAIARMRREVRRYNIIKELSVKGSNQQQQQKNNNPSRIPINHLEIPAELAFVLSNVDDDDDDRSVYDNRIKVGVGETLATTPRRHDNNENFRSFVLEFIRTDFAVKKEPILSPFLKTSPSTSSLQVFKLILRYVNDGNLRGLRDVLLLAYITNYGINDDTIRDEIIIQVMNQLRVNDRASYLLSACLSVFSPSDELTHSIMNEVNDICRFKLSLEKGGPRMLPPGVIELKTCSSKQPNQVYLEVETGLDYYSVARVESWTAVTDLADRVGRKMGLGEYGGFTLERDELEIDPAAYIFDCSDEFDKYKVFNKASECVGLFPRKPQQQQQNKSKSLDSVHGLSASKLNERYHSNEGKQYGSNDLLVASSEQQQHLTYGGDGQKMYSDGQLGHHGHHGNPLLLRGPPRYIKKKKYSKFSSALSDTSEAPSLASHVRRVRVPSQTEDVDQFLDDLFSPVIDNLDDLSDVRSLVSNLKGGGQQQQQQIVMETTHEKRRAADFIQSAMEQNLQIQQQLIAQNEALQRLLDEPKGNNSNNNFIPPPPPPLPDDMFLEGHRPFMDPYGRAKTVRIGKWRWPPKEGDEFSVADLQRLNSLSVAAQPPPQQQQPLVKVQRPFGGEVVGKLKLSENLRMKLEQVTSVRGPKSNNRSDVAAAMETREEVKKLDNRRKLELAEKLGGAIKPIQQNNNGQHHPLNHINYQQQQHQHQQPPPLPPANNPTMQVEDFYDDLSQVYNQVTHHRPQPQQQQQKAAINKAEQLAWKLGDDGGAARWRLRKDLYFEGDDEAFLARQIKRDLGRSNCWRILPAERSAVQRHGGNLVDAARKWQFYFARFFALVQAQGTSNNSIQVGSGGDHRDCGGNPQTIFYGRWG